MEWPRGSLTTDPDSYPLLFLILQIYGYVAVWLTDLELNRTQTEYDDSLSLKIYLLQFVNYYASIFYIAFFKGKFVGYPKEYNRFLGRLWIA